MSKRTSFTTTTPLPPAITRRTALAYLHDHLAMIDLNPLVQSRYHLLSPPAHAPASELQSAWYSITDRLAPGLPSPVSYTASFRNTPDGLQTHVYAPMGLEVRGQWTVRGSGDIGRAAPEAPESGLYIREDVELKSNVLVAGFVKKTLKRAHAGLVEKMVADAETGGRAISSPVDAFRFFADDETFLGPWSERAVENSATKDERRDHSADTRSFLTPPAPVTIPPHPTAAPPPPPPFLQTPRPRPHSLLNLTQPPSFLQQPQPKASAPELQSTPYPAPLRIPHRHSTCLSSLSSTPNTPTPDTPTPHWSRDSFPPRPEPTVPQRNISVVSRYPDAAKQDYSDIAATNPYDSPEDASHPDAFCGSTGSAPDSPPLTPVAESPAVMPGKHPFHLRFEFDFELESGADDKHGLGIKVAVPGEQLEERYEALQGKLPVLADKRASVQRGRVRTSLGGLGVL